MKAVSYSLIHPSRLQPMHSQSTRDINVRESDRFETTHKIRFRVTIRAHIKRIVPSQITKEELGR